MKAASLRAGIDKKDHQVQCSHILPANGLSPCDSRGKIGKRPLGTVHLRKKKWALTKEGGPAIKKGTKGRQKGHNSDGGGRRRDEAMPRPN